MKITYLFLGTYIYYEYTLIQCAMYGIKVIREKKNNNAVINHLYKLIYF